MQIETPDNHFEAVLISAVRYCIGRRTYMPETVTRWIMGHCHGVLSKQTLGVMTNDIITAPSLGDDCDVRTWAAFRGWLWWEKNADAAKAD